MLRIMFNIQILVHYVFEEKTLALPDANNCKSSHNVRNTF